MRVRKLDLSAVSVSCRRAPRASGNRLSSSAVRASISFEFLLSGEEMLNTEENVLTNALESRTCYFPGASRLCCRADKARGRAVRRCKATQLAACGWTGCAMQRRHWRVGIGPAVETKRASLCAAGTAAQRPTERPERNDNGQSN